MHDSINDCQASVVDFNCHCVLSSSISPCLVAFETKKRNKNPIKVGSFDIRRRAFYVKVANLWFFEVKHRKRRRSQAVHVQGGPKK